eukprot:6199935-Pleurochrysis_carterae.AAC.6
MGENPTLPGRGRARVHQLRLLTQARFAVYASRDALLRTRCWCTRILKPTSRCPESTAFSLCSFPDHPVLTHAPLQPDGLRGIPPHGIPLIALHLRGRCPCAMNETCVAQVSAGRSPHSALHTLSTVEYLRYLFRRGGLRELYRGFGWNVVGGVPSEVVYYAGYTQAKMMLMATPLGTMSPSAVFVAAGAIADALSVLVSVPTDVISQRLQ